MIEERREMMAGDQHTDTDTDTDTGDECMSMQLRSGGDDARRIYGNRNISKSNEKSAMLYPQSTAGSERRRYAHVGVRPASE